MGFADIEVVGSAKELKNVNTDEFIPLKDGRTLPIKFRIEEGALVEGGEIASAGGFHSCAVATNGDAYCWGRNNVGQLGIGSSAGFVQPPQIVTGGQTWQSVQAGTDHTCGLTTGGQIYCWGNNSVGQLGIGTTAGSHPAPELVVGGRTFQSLASLGGLSSFSTCGVEATTGDMYCWGLNTLGELGRGGRASPSRRRDSSSVAIRLPGRRPWQCASHAASPLSATRSAGDGINMAI